MLYYNFKNYEEFQELFGVIEHGNGVKSRKNKILLALYKDKGALRRHILKKEIDSVIIQLGRVEKRILSINSHECRKDDSRMCAIYDNLRRREADLHSKRANVSFVECSNLVALKNLIYTLLEMRGFYPDDCVHSLRLNDKTFWSNAFRTDSLNGICEDGTLNAIRYVNVERERVFKMKAGKMFNHVWSCNSETSKLPEQILRWMSEEFVAEWIEYARESIGDTMYKLHVDDNFAEIYDSERCVGNFGSCMVDDGYWTFYRDAVDAKAAYLTNSYGEIVARCIVFQEVHECGSDKIWRLAERQYSKDSELSLQRQLIAQLISGGHIDGYKKVGASCHDSHAFIDINGDSLADKRFWIDCRLESGDTVSYQDTFKWYDENNGRADNYNHGDIDLAITEGSFESGEWSQYHEEYIPSDDAVYVDSRDDYFYRDDVVYAENIYEDCFREDCIYIDGDYYYAGSNCEEPERYGINCCPRCGEYFLDSGEHSSLTEEDYCCWGCRDEAESEYKENYWHYSEYDDDFCEDMDDITTAYMWSYRAGGWMKTTIMRNTLAELYEGGEAIFFNDAWYIDEIDENGECVHAIAA